MIQVGEKRVCQTEKLPGAFTAEVQNLPICLDQIKGGGTLQ
jgi:hypothetical protein